MSYGSHLILATFKYSFQDLTVT